MSRVASGDVRQKILNAAQERLWHYGFKKTTIDEIASDAGVGKGTVYLYFDSKEDIALTIMAQFKMENLERVQAIQQDAEKPPLLKLKDMLTEPVLMVHERCLHSPAALELVIAVRPHIQARMRPFLEKEIILIAEALDEGNKKGVFKVADTLATARTLKAMCAGFWPPYPFVSGVEEIRAEIGRITDLVFCGLRDPATDAAVCT